MQHNSRVKNTSERFDGVALYDARLVLSKDMAICALPVAGAVLVVEGSPNRLT